MAFLPHTDSAHFHQVIRRARELIRGSRKLLLSPLPDTFLGRSSASEPEAAAAEPPDGNTVPPPGGPIT